MTHRLSLAALGVGSVFAFSSACSSSSGDKDDAVQGNGVGGTGTAIVLNGGANAGGNPAENTTDGLKPITATAANAMINGACQGWTGEPEGEGPAILEFMVDTTGSMAEETSSTNGRSKWEAMQEALPQALADLPSSWAVGLSFFSRPQDCYQPAQAVAIAPLDAQQQTRLGNAIQARGTGGYTPTEAAYLFALQTVRAWVAPTEYASSKRYVVLVTDGIPTVNSNGCTLGGGGGSTITLAEYGHLINTVAANTGSTGVETFVVGVPGSEDPQGATYDPMYQLSLVAAAGQTAIDGCTPTQGTVASCPDARGHQTTCPGTRGHYCHYDMTQATDFGAGLRDAIGTIASSVVSCDYAVPPAPAGQSIDAAKTNMIYDDGAGNYSLVLQNKASDCSLGWHFTDTTYSHIQVCSTTCDLLQSNPRAKISLVFGCAAGSSTVE